MSDYKWLSATNIEIGKGEEEGDKSFFEDLLAPKFVFMRRDGSIVSREEFLADLKPGPERKTSVTSITLFGSTRAVVTTIVLMNKTEFHNIRLFVLQEERWKLLSWANEQITFSPGAAGTPSHAH